MDELLRRVAQEAADQAGYVGPGHVEVQMDRATWDRLLALHELTPGAEEAETNVLVNKKALTDLIEYARVMARKLEGEYSDDWHSELEEYRTDLEVHERGQD